METKHDQDVVLVIAKLVSRNQNPRQADNVDRGNDPGALKIVYDNSGFPERMVPKLASSFSKYGATVLVKGSSSHSEEEVTKNLTS